MNGRLHEFCLYSTKGLGKARDERVASAFGVILALPRLDCPFEVEKPGACPRSACDFGDWGARRANLGLIRLKWIVLKGLLDFFQNLRSQFCGCFGGSQSLFKLPFFGGAENHRADFWILETPSNGEDGLGDSQVGCYCRELSYFSDSFLVE